VKVTIQIHRLQNTAPRLSKSFVVRVCIVSGNVDDRCLQSRRLDIKDAIVEIAPGVLWFDLLVVAQSQMHDEFKEMGQS
jgi:hypothetical protein